MGETRNAYRNVVMAFGRQSHTRSGKMLEDNINIILGERMAWF
jgi:hypothetical protein